MADFIIHHNGAYNIFGTIADGVHYVSALTLDQLRNLMRDQYGERGMENFHLRLERAHATGCSGHGRTLDDCIAENRWTGDGEGRPGCMPRDEFIRRYLTLDSAAAAAPPLNPDNWPSTALDEATGAGGVTMRMEAELFSAEAKAAYGVNAPGAGGPK